MNFNPPSVNRLAAMLSPENLTSQYNTQLSPEQEQQFQAWRANLPRQLQYEGDYDLRGAFLDNVQASANAHFTDKFKKPNHPSFSVESQYSRGPTMVGGKWGPGEENFIPSPFNRLYDQLR